MRIHINKMTMVRMEMILMRTILMRTILISTTMRSNTKIKILTKIHKIPETIR
jgi:hypothetical protein